MTRYIELPTVGDILQEEFLKPLGLSQNALAAAINVPANRINGIINGSRGMTADTDLRLTRYFGLSEGYFIAIQDHIDLVRTKQNISAELDKIIPLSRHKKQHVEIELMEG